MKSCLVVDDSKVVRLVARKILEGLNFRIEEAENGKIAVEACQRQMPDAILLNPGALEPEEMRAMQQHTTRGYQILTRIPHLRQSALIALCHHERIDGKGYPLGLRGEEIPIEARIFAVADTLDVILSGRPYCPPRSMATARKELVRCAGTQFDADVVAAFLEIPAEEWVRLQEAVARRVSIPDTPLPILHGVSL